MNSHLCVVSQGIIDHHDDLGIYYSSSLSFDGNLRIIYLAPNDKSLSH